MRKRQRKGNGYGFIHDLKRDWATLRSQRGLSLIRYIWDYYKVPIFVAFFVLFSVYTVGRIIWEGHRPYRLQVCVVLNTDDYCQRWFYSFEEQLKQDGRPGDLDLNQDQPFDYDNMYYYVMEMEVMTTVSSQRMDVAVCGKDMYSYLLAINACLPLDQSLPDDFLNEVSDRLVYSTANLQYDKNGHINPEDGIDGYFALDLEGTAFETEYNQPNKWGEDPGPLYAVIISNTQHLDDSITLLQSLVQV